MIYEATVAGVPVRLDLNALRPESVAFLLTYGVKQYVQDGAAVSKLHASGERKGEAKTDDEIAAEKADGVRERLANIEAGTFATRGPAEPKMTPEEKHRAAYIEEIIKGAAAASKTATPPRTGKNADKAWWDKMSAQVYAKYQAKVDKEVARRLRAAVDAIEIDFA